MMRLATLRHGVFRGLVPVVGALLFLATPLVSAAQYPNRPITLVVPWAAGGGTDATARIVAHGLEEELGQPVNVVNRTGGSGVVGHTVIARAKPDGYTIGMATVELGMMHWQGLTQLTYREFTPIAQVNYDPGAIQVSADAPWGSVTELLEAIKKKPMGTFFASGTGQGGIWDVAMAGLLLNQGIDPEKVSWVPSQGAAPGLRDLVAGGVQIVPCSIPEARTMIQAGKVKSLAVMSENRSPIFPDVPTLQQAIGSDFSLGAWRGIVGPKGLPDDITKTLEAALQKVYNSDEFKAFMDKRGYGMKWRDTADFSAYIAKNDKQMGKIMKAVGLAK